MPRRRIDSEEEELLRQHKKAEIARKLAELEKKKEADAQDKIKMIEKI